MHALIRDVCFSLSGFLHFLWLSLGPSTSPQMADVYTLSCKSRELAGTCRNARKLSAGFRDGPEGREGRGPGRDICIYTADSLLCRVATNAP